MNKDYFAAKDLAKLNIGGTTYFRVVHHLGGFITAVSVFELGEDKEDEALFLTEVSIEDVSPKIKHSIMSNGHMVDVTNDDKSLIIEAFDTKMRVMKDFAEKHLNVRLKRKLMQFIEVGGHYFGFVYEEGMPYTKLYHLHVDPVNDELYVEGVTPEMLPALFEALSPKILGSNTDLTIQVGDGVYARVSLMDKKKALVTVVVASEGNSGEAQLRVFSGFTLTKKDNEQWLATIIHEDTIDSLQEEIQKSFEIIYQELLIKVYEVNGEEALKGL